LQKPIAIRGQANARIRLEWNETIDLVLGGVVATMALIGLVATWIPARHALAVNPARLLRDE
jgi:ABC-type lipoprotein release transport system permease subunit